MINVRIHHSPGILGERIKHAMEPMFKGEKVFQGYFTNKDKFV